MCSGLIVSSPVTVSIPYVYLSLFGTGMRSRLTITNHQIHLFRHIKEPALRSDFVLCCAISRSRLDVVFLVQPVANLKQMGVDISIHTDLRQQRRLLPHVLALL